MKVVYDYYGPGQEIPVKKYLKNRKFVKYLNRESMAAIVATGRILYKISVEPETPFYYSTGLLEYEDYGLSDIVSYSTGEDGRLSQKAFVEFARLRFSPLSQFKVLQNMPLSFVSINYGLTGDSAVVQCDARGLLLLASHSSTDVAVFLGAGRVFSDGGVAVGVAHLEKGELGDYAVVPGLDPVEMLRHWLESKR